MRAGQSVDTWLTDYRPGLGNLAWLVPYAVRGIFELVRARIIFDRMTTKDIVARNAWSAKQRALTTSCTNHSVTLGRIAYVIPRIADRLPWRSDCLIQAIAAQNWLARSGLVSEIQIGVERSQESPFGAHAWLIHEGKLVTGGDISRYQTLLG